MRVHFTCPGCGSALSFDREDRWGQTSFEVPCVLGVRSALSEYFPCSAKFLINTNGPSTKVYYKRSRGVLPPLWQEIPSELV
jgi:hypothetical protein